MRGNEPVDPEWFADTATPGWQQRWLENFVANMTPGEWPAEDLVNDGWTDLSKRMRGRILERSSGSVTTQQIMAEVEAADFEKMSEIRSRVDTIVGDRATADRLKAWYRQLCKRPCFHDEYLDAYNLPTVHLIDTDGKGVERITPAGVVVAGVEYPVDCIIYASGFEVGTAPTRRTGFDVTGRAGIKLSEYWADGMRSMHGIHVHGFPNAFVVQLSQGANFVANVPHNLSDSAKTVAAVLAHAANQGFDQVEVSKEAEDAWMEMMVANPIMRSFLATCTPGYYNNEGGELSTHSLFGGYVDGAAAYFRYIEKWRQAGDFAGLSFNNAALRGPVMAGRLGSGQHRLVFGRPVPSVNVGQDGNLSR